MDRLRLKPSDCACMPLRIYTHGNNVLAIYRNMLPRHYSHVQQYIAVAGQGLRRPAGQGLPLSAPGSEQGSLEGHSEWHSSTPKDAARAARSGRLSDQAIT